MVILYPLRRCPEKREMARANARNQGDQAKEVMSGEQARRCDTVIRNLPPHRRLDATVLVDFGGGAKDQPALFAVHARELLGEQAQLARGFLVEAPDRGGGGGGGGGRPLR